MTKPFHKDELVARIQALVRRSKGKHMPNQPLKSTSLRIDLDTKGVEVGGARVHLTSKEYKILQLLALRRTRRSPKKVSFLNHLYGGMDEPEAKIVDVFICKLRRKLSNASCGAARITSKRCGDAAIHCAKPSAVKEMRSA